MTAIGVIILLTQILPSLGYNPKEDLEYVNQFKPQAEEIIFENILKDEAGERILVLEDFKENDQIEYIEFLRNARFQLVGYRRYRA